MGAKPDFNGVFESLKGILAFYTDELTPVRNAPGDFYLETLHTMKNGQRLFFGAVQIRKAYVSFHLMPIYVFPELLQGISAPLRRRLHGKSCFNFKSLDPVLFEELASLTDRGFQRYREAGYLPDERSSKQ